ncbi:helix-turn-helix transcriptional regulator [Nonomuraea sp. K274]|uniref:Helix-turn-helix transcriptional regulator n=2 Tax=Nonomuraea cypriaca TaxID=1187855 RepID=A0A931APD2_9ACTN|nr:helix-turn-helix transcriptional regulator [Nonomuraea cypriaca]
MRKFRKSLGLSHERLAASAGVTYSESQIGAVERGARTPSETFTEEIEQVLGLNGELKELLPDIHNDVGPAWFRPWPGVEAAAHSIRTWEPLVIPGLLQTERYAEQVLLGEPGTTMEQVQKGVKIRLKRQEVFSRSEPPMYSTLLDETALHRPIGGEEVMREQLAHLLTAMRYPRITVRIVPLIAGLTTGLEGAFEIAQADGSPDTGYVESSLAAEVTNRVHKVRALGVRWDALSSMAHPVNVSEKVIREAMERYEN